MDAPPEVEDSHPFADIAGRLRAAGLHAPEIIHKNMDQGFLLLEDLGDDLYRDRVGPENGQTFMDTMLPVLARMSSDVDHRGLPDYDAERLLQELMLFPDWYLARHKGISLGCEQLEGWEDLCRRLIESAREQPQVFVHRDFHSCNLLATPSGTVGIIDFQDAVRGPLCYDFISLVWDRYISWPREQLLAWMEAFRNRVAPETEHQTWVRWCDWMGLQRNLKVVGIFTRLHYRDSKEGYIEMIPRFWDYLIDVLHRYPETSGFHRLLEDLKCAP